MQESGGECGTAGLWLCGDLEKVRTRVVAVTVRDSPYYERNMNAQGVMGLETVQSLKHQSEDVSMRVSAEGPMLGVQA